MGCLGSPVSDADATQGCEPLPSYITDSGNDCQVLKVSRGRQSVGNFPEELLNYHHHHSNPPIIPSRHQRSSDLRYLSEGTGATDEMSLPKKQNPREFPGRPVARAP